MKPRLGIVGCGAVSEMLHLPAILARDDVQLTAAIDKNLDRAGIIAKLSGARPFATVAEALLHNLHA